METRELTDGSGQAMLIFRRFIAILSAPLIAGVPAAFAEFAVVGQVPSSFGDFLPVLLFVSRFGFAATIAIGIPIALVYQRYRRFSFWAVLGLGATLGLMVALAVHPSVAPRTVGWALACCVLPGVVGAASLWWIGSWSARPPLARAIGRSAGSASPGSKRWNRNWFIAVVSITLALAAALVIPRPDWSGLSSAELQRRARNRPRTPTDLFSAAQWQAVREREPQLDLEHFRQMFELRLRDGTGVIPFDEELLARVTFVGISVREVQEILGPSPYETGQPFGKLYYAMWPMAKICAQPALILGFEPDPSLERRIVSETIGRGAVLCVE